MGKLKFRFLGSVYLDPDLVDLVTTPTVDTSASRPKGSFFKGPKPCFGLSKRSQNESKLRAGSVPAAKGLRGGSGGPLGPQNIKKKRVLEPFWDQHETQKTRCALRGLLGSIRLQMASETEPKWLQNRIQKGPMPNMENCAPA